MFNALLNEINILLPGGVHLGLSKQQELQFCTAARRSKNKSPLEVSFHVFKCYTFTFASFTTSATAGE